ncbi:hypothetical protein [Kitasatospora mediocidica]|uniref:hypothetical protein n=1 Tax=Kitasatospora mediocidica TaxID=58352 RepID=UPI00055F7250|nr:hypothetical protein [Kitasatospora mediocidica]
MVGADARRECGTLLTFPSHRRPSPPARTTGTGQARRSAVDSSGQRDGVFSLWGSANFAFLGQYVEVPEDVDSEIPPIYHALSDPKTAYHALKTAFA